MALALLTAAIVLWVSKSKKRKLERLERRNSIRQSLHSLRSVGSTSGFTELAYRRKPIAVSDINVDRSRFRNKRSIFHVLQLISYRRNNRQTHLTRNRWITKGCLTAVALILWTNHN